MVLYSVYFISTKEMATPSIPGGFGGLSVPANVLSRDIIAVECATTIAWCDQMLGASSIEMPVILQLIPDGKCLFFHIVLFSAGILMPECRF